MSRYKVLVGCEVGEKNYSPGDFIAGAKLTDDLIDHWIEKGVIKMATESKPKKAETKQKEV